MSTETKKKAHVCSFCYKSVEEPLFEGKCSSFSFLNITGSVAATLCSIPTVPQDSSFSKRAGVFIFDRDVRDVVFCSSKCSISFTAHQERLRFVFQALGSDEMYMNEKHKADVEAQLDDKVQNWFNRCESDTSPSSSDSAPASE